MKFTHQNSIYSQHLSLIPPFKACSFSLSLCSSLKCIFLFKRVNWPESWNMTAKLAEILAWSSWSWVDEFAVVTARQRLGTWPFISSRVVGTNFLILQTMPDTNLQARRSFRVQREILWVSAVGEGIWRCRACIFSLQIPEILFTKHAVLTIGDYLTIIHRSAGE